MASSSFGFEVKEVLNSYCGNESSDLVEERRYGMVGRVNQGRGGEADRLDLVGR